MARVALVGIGAISPAIASDVSLACDAMVGVEYSEPPEWIEVELDAERWHTALRARGDSYARKEYVRELETLSDWTELITWNISFGDARFDLETVHANYLAALERQCKGLESHELYKSDTERIFEFKHDGCFSRPAQHEIMRLVSGKTGLHTLVYARRGRLDEEQLALWTKRIADTPVRRRVPMSGDMPPLDRARLLVWNARYPQAVERLRPLAEAGDAGAQELFGRLLVEGWGVPQDRKLARTWLARAAKDEPRAAYNLARLYENGWGGDADMERAISWYRSAAERGHGDAMGRLGVLYLEGTLVPKDSAAARRWLEKALEAGHDDARYWLAQLAEQTARAEDQARARDLYLEAARRGNRDAQFRVGVLYADGSLGFEKDAARAKVWLTRATMQGQEEARTFYLSRYRTER